MQIFVRGLDGRTMTLQIDQQASIASVKELIQMKEGSIIFGFGSSLILFDHTLILRTTN
jgi:hypothetical protein